MHVSQDAVWLTKLLTLAQKPNHARKVSDPLINKDFNSTEDLSFITFSLTIYPKGFIFRFVLKRPKPDIVLYRMSQVRIPYSLNDQLSNFKPDDSMVECHAKRAFEKIAEKKEESNVEKLDQLVDQLKVEIESKDTVYRALKILKRPN